MTLANQCNSIRTREDFVAFVKALHRDLRDHSGSWENRDLESYLAALAAWVEDMDGYYLNHGMPIPQQPDWKVAADMLLAAKMYE